MQRYKWGNGSGIYKHFRGAIWNPTATIKRGSYSRSSLVLFFATVFFSVAFLAVRLLDSTSLAGSSPPKTILPLKTTHFLNPKAPTIRKKPPEPVIIHGKPKRKFEFPPNCSSGNVTRTCPTNYYPSNFRFPSDPDLPLPSTCPEHFRWIHEDLRPWRETGITREMVEGARPTANFRLVIQGGRAYVETYKKSFQSRDTFTLWGILQLLRKYPGRVPDLDLVFDCVDWPVVIARNYRGPNATAPPPLFRYCKDDATLDIPFPDWSFWGWPEINIKPWVRLMEELKEGNERVKWIDREPYAYWKGNPAVAETRMDLLKCNASDKQDWGARIYVQDWLKETRQGFKQSDLASQCIHRYKIYIEGSAWSVSEKYILACNSPTLLVYPRYYDFFTRSLMPLQHFWPVRENDKCRSIKFAVDWGNRHKRKAQDIGNAASDFIQENLKMDYVYDYMFHLLNEYAQLLKYEPSVPPKAIELCSEAMACSAQGFTKTFMAESIVTAPSEEGPCTMLPPYDHVALRELKRRKTNSLKQVESLEKRYWKNRTVHN